MVRVIGICLFLAALACFPCPESAARCTDMEGMCAQQSPLMCDDTEWCVATYTWPDEDRCACALADETATACSCSDD